MPSVTNRISPTVQLAFAGAVLLYLYFVFFLFPATPIFKEGDYLIHMNNAMRTLGGEVIYRDFIQVVFPGTEFWYASLIGLAGPLIALANASSLVLGFCLTLLCLKISEQIFDGAFRFVPPAIFLAFGFFWYGADPSHRLFSLVFVIAALYVVIKGQSRWMIFAAGFLCGISSVFTQPRGLAGVLAFSLFFIWQAFAGRSDWKRCAGLIGTLSLGFAVPVLVVTVLCYLQSGNDFLYYTTTFLGRYTTHRQNNYASFLREITTLFDERNVVVALLKLFYLVLLPLAFAAFWIWRRVRKNVITSELDERLMLLGFFALGLLATNFAPTTVRMYHVAMPMLILAVYMLADAVRHKALAAKLLLAVCAAFAVVQVVRVQADQRYTFASLPTGRVAFSPGLNPERYLWLADNTKPGDVFFESYTRTYFPLLLKNPTRLPMIYDTPYTSADEVAAALDILKREKPRYILWDGLWSKPAAERLAGDNLAPMYEFLQEEYSLRIDLEDYDHQDFEIWERRVQQ